MASQSTISSKSSSSFKKTMASSKVTNKAEHTEDNKSSQSKDSWVVVDAKSTSEEKQSPLPDDKSSSKGASNEGTGNPSSSNEASKQSQYTKMTLSGKLDFHADAIKSSSEKQPMPRTLTAASNITFPDSDQPVASNNIFLNVPNDLNKIEEVSAACEISREQTFRSERPDQNGPGSGPDSGEQSLS